MEWPPKPDVPPDPRDLEKLARFRKQSDHDAVDETVRSLATRVVRPLKPDDWLGMAKEIHRFVRDGIKYQHDHDRKQEMIDAVTTIHQGWGNCVGKTILATALLRSLGMKAEIWPVWTGPIMTHVVYRTKFPGSKMKPGNVDGWIYGELTIKGVEPGEDPTRVRRNPDTGALPLSGG